jgi:hypothetical protein
MSSCKGSAIDAWTLSIFYISYFEYYFLTDHFFDIMIERHGKNNIFFMEKHDFPAKDSEYKVYKKNFSCK